MTYLQGSQEFGSAAQVYLGQVDPLAWTAEFSAKYQALRADILARAKQLEDPGWFSRGNQQGILQSAQNAMVRWDSIAAQITAGDTSRASALLNTMKATVQVYISDPEEQATWMDRIADVIRGIPKNLADAASFLAEEAGMAVRKVVPAGAGLYIAGAVAVGLLGLYLWKR